MVRKIFKRELTTTLQDSSNNAEALNGEEPVPMSSQDTILLDSDVTMMDESCENNNQSKKSSRSTITSPQKGSNTDFLNGQSHDPKNDSEDGLQVLGRGVKKLVQAVQELRHIGVEALDLPLPKIVVVGDQSTGKSSLIEGISEIKVPRAAGTCTRCPMELNITESSSPWSCKISLHKMYVYEGSNTAGRVLGKTATKSEGATRARPLGPWALQDAEDFPFAVVTNKEDVPHALYLAQLATLNPSSPYEKYVPGTPGFKEGFQVKFSPNVVRLDISGPHLPNLSFYDLPGVINVSELAEEAYLVDLVKNLVKQYIKAEDCINLLALPMTDDPANSSASRLIWEAKAEARTLGCLTKPDRMQRIESWDQWIHVLSGQRFQLGFGYHVVMNNPDVSVSHTVARQEEETFFREQEPWATTLDTYSNRFGTLRLQTVLSQRLTAQIRKSLPRITGQVKQKAKEIGAMLKQLPEPLDRNVAVSVMSELIQFQRQLEKNIDGGQNTNVFHKAWAMTAGKFLQDLAETRPVLVFPSTSLRTPQHSQSSKSIQASCSTPTPVGRNLAPISIDSDNSDNEDISTNPSPNFQRSGQKRPPTSARSTPKKLPKRGVTDSPSIQKTKQICSKRFSLDEVQNILQNAYIGLNNLVDPKAIEEMISLSTEHWEEPLKNFLESTRELCEAMVFEQMQGIYAKYEDTQYYEAIRRICEDFFNNAFAEQCELLKRVLKWEQSRPKTCNDDAINLAQTKALTLLQTRRREMRATVHLDEQEARTGKASTGQARADKLAKISDDQLGPDPYKKEIEAISTVKAYYECAYFRFVDTVCASIHCELLTKCRNDIIKEMRNTFRLTDPDVEERLRVLLAANPVQEQRRAQLLKEMDTITKAQERLEGLTDDE